ncbi:hypothetical protein [Pseudomonas viridiflava]|uniref:hypothetical protein n=1 Tax=Pseudomonas viridiflava TaxID=33069 RepID=UPI00197D8276|nr:hypothetical protein [Pseudomonas viridiflava]
MIDSTTNGHNDVLRLSGLMTGEAIELSESITADMVQFLELLGTETIDLKSLKIRGGLPTIIGRIAESSDLQAAL